MQKIQAGPRGFVDVFARSQLYRNIRANPMLDMALFAGKSAQSRLTDPPFTATILYTEMMEYPQGRGVFRFCQER